MENQPNLTFIYYYIKTLSIAPMCETWIQR